MARHFHLPSFWEVAPRRRHNVGTPGDTLVSRHVRRRTPSGRRFPAPTGASLRRLHPHTHSSVDCPRLAARTSVPLGKTHSSVPRSTFLGTPLTLAVEFVQYPGISAPLGFGIPASRHPGIPHPGMLNPGIPGSWDSRIAVVLRTYIRAPLCVVIGRGY